MAERRMFAKTIIDSDAFLDMPTSSQCLYFHLAMRADDDGFINAPKKILRMVGATDDDIKVLIAKRFIIPFDSGVVVIKHWRIHNYIQNDRKKGTPYKEEMAMLELKPNNAYTLKGKQEWDGICALDTKSKKLDTKSEQMDTESQKLDTQVRLGKDRLISLGESKGKNPTTQKHKHGKYNNVLLTDEELQKLKEEFPSNWQEWIDRVSEYSASSGKTYKNNLATIRNWARRDSEKVKEQNKLETPKSYELEDVQSKMFAQFMSATEGVNDDDGREDDRDFPF